MLLLVAPALRSGVAAETSASAIPLEQLGAEAQKNYTGDGISITPTAQGALLRSTFQKLEGEATAEGLWLSSTTAAAAGPERFRVLATALGRCAGTAASATASQPLPATGTVTSTSEAAALMRPGLLEEYRVSMDGVRQDFVVLQRPEGAGALCLTLAVTGAQVAAADYGIKLTLPRSGREIGYSRLHVTDATGRELTASLEVLAPDRIAVRVEDATATYPVRIDPTFSDSDWVSMSSGILGTNGTVYAMTMDGSGNLYVGGTFTTAGAVSASNIAKWDGVMWSALGTGVDNKVTALAVSGTNVYAGGSFITAGGVTVNHVAKWDGTAWSALGAGVDNSVTALAVSGGTLYAGGSFATAGGVSASHIAQWDGTAWSALGSGMNNNVLALVALGGSLYAGGQFTTAGGSTANHIAKWDGSAWSAMGSLYGAVNSLVFSGTTLYAGGTFSQIGRSSLQNVASWNGTSWSLSTTGSNNPVQVLAASGSDIYAAGPSATTPVISKWNGSFWSAVGTQTTWFGAIAFYALAANGTDLFIGGSVQPGNSYYYHSNIAKWNGSAVTQLFSGINGTVGALVVSGSYLYAGGAFTAALGVAAGGIARWDGSTWTALGTGVNGSVTAILVHGTDVYVGGSFTMAGGVAANNVAKWDGSAWSALGQGISGTVNPYAKALAMIGTDLYVGGHFTRADGVTVNGIAKWDGSAWSALDIGLGGGDPSANALAVIGTDLYVGGYFSTAGSVSVSNIAKWDGSAWSALDSGDYPGTIVSLAVSGTRLYAGGTPGGFGIISIWDGRSHLGYLSTPFSQVYTVLISGTNIYAGGAYSSFMGPTGNGVAKWDGNNWSSLGSGITWDAGTATPSVYALAVDASNHLFVGGASFTKVGSNTLSPNLAQANLPTPTPDIAVTQSAALTDGTSSVDFGPASVGSANAALTFTLTNPGDAALSGLSLSLDGTNAADFTVSTLTSTSFVPGNTLTFTVTYSPGALATSSAALHIASNVSGAKNPFDIALTGTGVTPNQGWQQQYFGVITGLGNAAPDADPNHNGIPNLLEYALGGNPMGTATGTNVLPGATLSTWANSLQFNFQRYLDRNDITLTVQAADDPAGPWTDLAQSINGSAFNGIAPGANILELAFGNPRSVAVFDIYQFNDPAHPRRFMRLQVSQ